MYLESVVVEKTSLTWEQIKERVVKSLDSNRWLHRHGDEWYGTIYVDYRDELGDAAIDKIIESVDKYGETGLAAISDYLDENAWEQENYEKDYVFNEVKSDVAYDDEGELAVEEYEDEINDFINDHVWFSYDPKDFDKEITVDIQVDTGNWNYDCTNDHALDWYAGNGYRLDEFSTMLWLAKQQRKKGKLLKAIKATDFNTGDKFVDSMTQEFNNVTSACVTLTFCVNMMLSKFLELRDAVNKAKKATKKYGVLLPDSPDYEGSITISKDATCGLFEAWNGSGSLLEIQLDKDVVLPLRNIGLVAYDKADRIDNGYSLHNVYGVSDDMWQGDVTLNINS